MKKTQVKSLVLSAAVSGLLTAAAPAFASSTATSNSNPTLSSSAVRMMANAFQSDKHGCKGQNNCKGQGGCKAGDNGCKGKNSCKGKGGCATDGSKNHLA